MNQYVISALVLLAAVVLVVRRWNRLAEAERRVVAIGCAIILLLAFWVPTVTPAIFVRYLVAAMPVGALLAAWVLVRGSGSRAKQLAWPGAAVLAVTPWLSMPFSAFITPPTFYQAAEFNETGTVFRRELSVLRSEVFGHRPDPNRLVIDWLKQNAAPTDEILINYEDIPLMFYLPNPIRGGIPAFRVEDDAQTPPRFVILRKSVAFVHWTVFLRELKRYGWSPVPVKAPDVTWGNNPDPMGRDRDPTKAPADIVFGRRQD